MISPLQMALIWIHGDKLFHFSLIRVISHTPILMVLIHISLISLLHPSQAHLCSPEIIVQRCTIKSRPLPHCKQNNNHDLNMSNRRLCGECFVRLITAWVWHMLPRWNEFTQSNAHENNNQNKYKYKVRKNRTIVTGKRCFASSDDRRANDVVQKNTMQYSFFCRI